LAFGDTDVVVVGMWECEEGGLLPLFNNPNQSLISPSEIQNGHGATKNRVQMHVQCNEAKAFVVLYHKWQGCTIQSVIEKRIDEAGQLRGNEIRSLVADVWLSRIRYRV
jgi:hypothetical protein